MANKKLNSMRILEQHNIPYEALHYDASAFHSADEVAELVGVGYHLVYKTLVVQSVKTPKNLFLAVIPGNHTLTLKAMANITGEKKVQLASHKDAEKFTGLQVGGISPLALTHKNWPVYLAQTATEHTHILVSGGQRGVQLRVPTQEFIRLVKAKLGDISSLTE